MSEFGIEVAVLQFELLVGGNSGIVVDRRAAIDLDIVVNAIQAEIVLP